MLLLKLIWPVMTMNHQQWVGWGTRRKAVWICYASGNQSCRVSRVCWLSRVIDKYLSICLLIAISRFWSSIYQQIDVYLGLYIRRVRILYCWCIFGFVSENIKNIGRPPWKIQTAPPTLTKISMIRFARLIQAMLGVQWDPRDQFPFCISNHPWRIHVRYAIWMLTFTFNNIPQMLVYIYTPYIHGSYGISFVVPPYVDGKK